MGSTIGFFFISAFTIAHFDGWKLRWKRSNFHCMSDIAFLFPGQGSQYSGMGKLLSDAFPTARRTFEEADETLGFKLSELCFQGSDEDLKKTENTQPALLAVSTAAERVLAEQGIIPAIVAGHSLGEYSALVAVKSVAFPDALRLVQMRGRFMQEAVPAGTGAMAAILKLPEGRLDAVLAEAAQTEVVSAANLNSPDQTVISGHAGAVARAMSLALAAGAKRAIPLPVSAPFHCSLMQPAQRRLIPLLEQTTFLDLTVPLLNNWQANVITSGAEARRGLIEQIPNSVRWAETVGALKRNGIARFVEVGPGSVLMGLCRSIEPGLRGTKFGEPADLEKLLALAAAR
jgi:[acyl-carrier-protein] S-malonyltransferase